jgi:hypothetical protein
MTLRNVLYVVLIVVALDGLVYLDSRLARLPDSMQVSLFDLTRAAPTPTPPPLRERLAIATFVARALSPSNPLRLDGPALDRLTRLRRSATEELYLMCRIVEDLPARSDEDFPAWLREGGSQVLVGRLDYDQIEATLTSLPAPRPREMLRPPAGWRPERESEGVRRRWKAMFEDSPAGDGGMLDGPVKMLVLYVARLREQGRLSDPSAGVLRARLSALIDAMTTGSAEYNEARADVLRTPGFAPPRDPEADIGFDEFVAKCQPPPTEEVSVGP